MTLLDSAWGQPIIVLSFPGNAYSKHQAIET